jgi:hypothetical protein
MAVEIREIVLTARVVEPAPAMTVRDSAAAQRVILETCLAEVNRLLERRAQR